MEGESWKKGFSEMGTQMIPYSHSQADHQLSPEAWHDVKTKVSTLLDDSLPRSCKKSIADQLYQLFERLERRPANDSTDSSVCAAPSGMEICRFSQRANNDPRSERRMIEAADEFNERLRTKIVEFNEGLAHLSNKILRLKSKLLSWNNRSTSETDPPDLETCRNVNRNFRRILQKESRYLRDELYAARETIQRLQKGSSSSGEQREPNVELMSYYELKCRPTDFIDVESDRPRLWLMSPIKTLECVTPTTKLLQSRSALMKRAASPLEMVAGPEVKTGKFICSLNGAIEAAPSSLVQWTINQAEKLPIISENNANCVSRYEYHQTEDSEQRKILISR